MRGFIRELKCVWDNMWADIERLADIAEVDVFFMCVIMAFVCLFCGEWDEKRALDLINGEVNQ